MITLDYFQKTPRFQWRAALRRRWRSAIVCVLLGALASLGAISYYRPWIWYPSKDAYLWHLYLTHMVRSGTVIYEDDPARTAALGSDAQYLSSIARPALWWGDRPLVGSLIPWEWKAHPIFMHGRTAPQHGERLVVVGFRGFEGNNYPADGSLELTFKWVSIPSGDRDNRHWVLGNISAPFRQGRTRLYAGQPDPADDSHFTIKYEIDHIPGTIDGWLQPDDTVKLQIRDGPALNATTAPTSAPSTEP